MLNVERWLVEPASDAHDKLVIISSTGRFRDIDQHRPHLEKRSAQLL